MITWKALYLFSSFTDLNLGCPRFEANREKTCSLNVFIWLPQASTFMVKCSIADHTQPCKHSVTAVTQTSGHFYHREIRRNNCMFISATERLQSSQQRWVLIGLSLPLSSSFFSPALLPSEAWLKDRVPLPASHLQEPTPLLHQALLRDTPFSFYLALTLSFTLMTSNFL